MWGDTGIVGVRKWGQDPIDNRKMGSSSPVINTMPISLTSTESSLESVLKGTRHRTLTFPELYVTEMDIELDEDNADNIQVWFVIKHQNIGKEDQFPYWSNKKITSQCHLLLDIINELYVVGRHSYLLLQPFRYSC